MSEDKEFKAGQMWTFKTTRLINTIVIVNTDVERGFVHLSYGKLLMTMHIGRVKEDLIKIEGNTKINADFLEMVHDWENDKRSGCFTISIDEVINLYNKEA